ncbi:hypothetical protein HAZT_HAZT009175 [Hyalella azteca]|nr:hypothetical protein HAZT_HAZT009175 [Hyalella azteca]
MKVTVPEISFHNRDPVLSVDVQHNSPDDVIRMATGGTDTHVIVWQLNPLPTGGVGVEVLCDLVRHNRSVNAVRFSPDGTLLASADDEAAIIVWKKQEAYSSAAPDLFASEGEERNKENWTIYKMLRGHIEDVYDLSWSSCSNFLISGSIDNSAIMWDVHKAKNIGLLKEHKNFVQGVAWDPLGQFVATLSSDRVLRWFSVSTKRALHRVSKAELPVTLSSSNTSTINTRLFFDDTLKSFCRRLAFSPDGMLLAAPAGILEGEQLGPRFLNAVHVFTRLSPDKPAIYLPTRDKYSLAVRFCPLLFKLRAGRKKSPYHGQSVFALPYRMVFAVACQNSVLLYDTQQLMPFAMVSNMHITRLTDLSWSSDGRILAISSTDGYCSITYFNEGELGEVYSPNPEARCTPLKKNVLNDSNSLPTPKEEGCLEDNIVDEKCIEETKNKKLPGEKTNVSSLNVEKEENALVVSKTELGLEDNVKIVNLTLEKENKVDASNVSISEKNKSRVSVLTAKKGHKNATTSPSKNKFCAELARDSMPENDEPRTSSQENCNAVPLNNEKDVQREDKDTIESDDCESIGSKDSESDEDDDDISLMSCDTDDDAKEKLSDEDMEATEIVFSNIKN